MTACHDCGLVLIPTDGSPTWEMYMVKDELWPDVDYLCIGCLESRLGRRLVKADFLDVPLNNPDRYPKMSERLRSRLTAELESGG